MDWGGGTLTTCAMLEAGAPERRIQSRNAEQSLSSSILLALSIMLGMSFQCLRLIAASKSKASRRRYLCVHLPRSDVVLQVSSSI